MCKMRTPEIDVIRFTESDIVAASGTKFMTIAGYGDPNNVGATFQIGSRAAWTSQQVYANQDAFEAEMDAYAGDKTWGKIWFDEKRSDYVKYLAMDDCFDSDGTMSVNGTYEWNGNKFLKKQ